MQDDFSSTGARHGLGLRVTLTAFAILLSACAAGPEDRDGASDPIVIGVRGDPGSFNVYTATNAFTQEVANLLYPRLAVENADFDSGPPSLRPSLATGWDLDDDGTTLVVRLDPDARWSDGRPIVAEDVVFSHRAAADPRVGWVGADLKERVESIRALDATTVEYRFTEPHMYQLPDAMEGNILPAHVFEAIPLEAWTDTPFDDAEVVGGPFALARYEPGALIELERNPLFHDAPLPRSERLVFRVIPDTDALVNELLGGDLDVMENVPEAAASRIEADGRFEIVRAPDLSYTFVCWNTARAPFDDPRVRRALTLAIDRDAIVEGLLPRTGRPSTGPIPSALWAHDAAIEPHPYDLAAAAELLARAGWRDTDGDGVVDRDGEPLRFTLETNQESRLRRDVAELVASQLARVGVTAVPRFFEFGAAIDRRERHEFDAFVSSWRESTKVDLKPVFHTSGIDGGYNYGRYSNPELDATIDRARAATSHEAAKAGWHRAQEILHDEQPYTFLFERDRLHAIRSGLIGFSPVPWTVYHGVEHWQREEVREPR